MPTNGDPGLGGLENPLDPVATDLLDELSGSLALLTARLAVVSRDHGRSPLAVAALADAQEEVAELRALLREVLAESRSNPATAHDTFVPVVELERTVDRWFRGSAPLPVHLQTTLDADARVAGPRAIFARLIGGVLRLTARLATSRILLTLDAGEAPGDPLLLLVEVDGPPPEPQPDGTRPVRPFLAWAATRMGGKLVQTAPSEALGGACFELSLPLLERPRGTLRHRSWFPEEGGSIGAPGRPLPIRVAVVDDDEAVRRVFLRRLARSGFEGQAWPPLPDEGAGSLALRLAAGDFDLALIDLHLGTVSGQAVAEALRELRGDAAIVLMTGGEIPDRQNPLRHVHKLDAWEQICETLREVSGR